MNSHIIIIGFLIALIVGLQIYVFISTKKKITRYRQILPKIKSFKTIKVYIPEDEIANVTPENIIENINIYNREPIIDHINSSNNDEGDEYENQNYFDESDSWIKIQRSFERKRIKLKNLEFYNANGWSVFDENITNRPLT